MRERINCQADERIYQPKIHCSLIHEISKIRKKTGLPMTVIVDHSFTNLRNRNTLAAYTLVRNPQGLLFEITMNTGHYVTEEQGGKKKKVWSFGKWAQLETLLHEQAHLWQSKTLLCLVL
jgi:hypothetical protein